MLPQNTKWFIIHKLRNRIIILIALIIIASISTMRNISTLQTKVILDSKHLSLANKLTELNKKVSSSEEAVKLWRNGLDVKYITRTGLRVELAKRRIEVIKKVYNIKNMNIILENPVNFSSIKDLEYENIVFSSLKIGFSSFSDIDSIKFLNALANQLPGMVIFKDISMQAPGNVIQNINSALGSGDITKYQNFVKTEVSLLWFDLEDKAGLTKESNQVK